MQVGGRVGGGGNGSSETSGTTILIKMLVLLHCQKNPYRQKDI